MNESCWNNKVNVGESQFVTATDTLIQEIKNPSSLISFYVKCIHEMQRFKRFITNCHPYNGHLPYEKWKKHCLDGRDRPEKAFLCMLLGDTLLTKWKKKKKILKECSREPLEAYFWWKEDQFLFWFYISNFNFVQFQLRLRSFLALFVFGQFIVQIQAYFRQKLFCVFCLVTHCSENGKRKRI